MAKLVSLMLTAVLLVILFMVALITVRAAVLLFVFFEVLKMFFVHLLDLF